jgi:hypothetical protein
MLSRMKKDTDILYEYDRAIDRLTRLHAYGNSLATKEQNEIIDRSEKLAKDDLLNLSIHARRLLTLSEGVDLAKKTKIPIAKFVKADDDKISIIEERSEFDLWRIINTIVHHDRLLILNSSFRVRLYVFPVPQEKINYMERAPLFPAIAVGSDQVALICFMLARFVDLFYLEVIDPLIERLSDKQIYLEASMREL